MGCRCATLTDVQIPPVDPGRHLLETDLPSLMCDGFGSVVDAFVEMQSREALGVDGRFFGWRMP